VAEDAVKVKFGEIGDGGQSAERKLNSHVNANYIIRG
jgi:hypothetical protein